MESGQLRVGACALEWVTWNRLRFCRSCVSEPFPLLEEKRRGGGLRGCVRMTRIRQVVKETSGACERCRHNGSASFLLKSQPSNGGSQRFHSIIFIDSIVIRN
ncbi:hypothetical protein AVEN_60797-1 [Araneus ventricosus]|uniref:Uncharacterized protein n=1 Tax=Araneus ventricosus TaxID=182803 RepID=A0A4Y2VH37_ARAVE|nr:hypothetical protein AVEN_60797-1 [Araneus ventricosus]